MKWFLNAVGVVLAALAFGGGATVQASPPALTGSYAKAVSNIEVRFEPATARAGQTVTWKLILDAAPGWHTYPTRQKDPKAESQVNEFDFPLPGDVVFVGDLKEPAPHFKPEPLLDNVVLGSYEGKVIWERSAVVSPQTQPGKKTVPVVLRLLICNEQSCLPPKDLKLEAELTVSEGSAQEVDPKYKDAVAIATQLLPWSESVQNLFFGGKNAAVGATSSPGSPTPRGNGGPTPETTQAGPDSPARALETADAYRASLERVQARLVRPKGGTADGPSGGGDLLAFMLAGVFWGAVSLITPCVFPMIPITVSFFLKQSEKEHHRPLTMAVVYCATIVVVLTIAAVALLSFFRALSVNPVMNFALGALFVFFALSLFGMYDIELPSFLARFTSAREGQGGLAGTMFMALTFTIVSFTCVAPFLGGFGGTAAVAQMTLPEKVLGGLAFAATFASPFFVLALFPSLLKKMPKSGSWLNSVKVVMGFLELAAAVKFLRAGELILLSKPSVITFDLGLGMYIALSVLCGLYLLNVYRLPHDSPAENISVSRLMIGFLFVTLGLYLLPALFRYQSEGGKMRPNGTVYAWIESFLLPDPSEAQGWTGNLEQAVNEAQNERKLVFVDFTGETCTNCKINEQNVFSKPEFKELFEPYKRVQMFTDKVPDKYYPPGVRATFAGGVKRQRQDAQANLAFQQAAFNTEQLPLYVILEPLTDGKVKVVGVYPEGKINDEAAFAAFLRDPLQGGGKGARAQLGGR
jgi:thiol:disulfide interchange protein DsbD